MGEFIKTKSFPSKGHHSIVDLGYFDGSPAIRKRIGHAIDYFDLQLWTKRMNEYREKVKKFGFKTPINFSTELIHSKTTSFIEVIDEYLGNNTLNKLSTNSLLIAWNQLIKQMILNFNSIDHEYSVGVMLDLKPDNVIFDGELYCIDFFPPILSDLNGNIFFFDETIFKNNHPMLQFVFGDIRGQITRMLFRIRSEYDCNVYNQLTLLTKQLIFGKISAVAENYIVSQIDDDLSHMNVLYFGNFEKAQNLLSLLITS